MIKKISLILMLSVFFISPGASNAFALNNTPSIEEISFKNAEIDGGFSPDVLEYGLTLDDVSVTPTLKSYKINGDAELFINYTYDEINRPVGITAALHYETGSLIYNFKYTNAESKAVSGEASSSLLSDIICTYGEISPKINDKDTKYKLYIPSDLTHLTITPVAKDINSYSAPVEIILTEEQSPEIFVTCTSSDGGRRNYSLEIKRVDKTLEQVKAEMQNPDYESFVDGTFIYQKPEFFITVGAAAAGLVILFILSKATRKITLNPYDEDEKPFYRSDG